MTERLTDKQFFDEEKRMKLTQDNVRYLNMHRRLAIWIWENLEPAKIVEIGCGPGALLESFLTMGLQAKGIDPNPYSKEYFDKRNPAFARHYLTQWPAKPLTCDVLVAIEVFEHLTDEQIHEILTARVTFKHLVFSSTPHFKGTPREIAWGHINVKQPHEWDEFFAQYEMGRTHLHPGITQWSCVYVKQ